MCTLADCGLQYCRGFREYDKKGTTHARISTLYLLPTEGHHGAKGRVSTEVHAALKKRIGNAHLRRQLVRIVHLVKSRTKTQAYFFRKPHGSETRAMNNACPNLLCIDTMIAEQPCAETISTLLQQTEEAARSQNCSNQNHAEKAHRKTPPKTRQLVLASTAHNVLIKTKRNKNRPRVL